MRFLSFLCENSIVCTKNLVESELFREITRIIISSKEYLPKEDNEKS